MVVISQCPVREWVGPHCSPLLHNMLSNAFNEGMERSLANGLDIDPRSKVLDLKANHSSFVWHNCLYSSGAFLEGSEHPEGQKDHCPLGLEGRKENSFTRPQTASLYVVMSEMPWIQRYFVSLIYFPSFSILNAHSCIPRRHSPTVLMEEHVYGSIQGM